jgi:FKBP-type peptidyl-prolyl cis-trans isomerase (trigger factor)
MSVNALDRARHAFADRIIEYAAANATVELPDLLVHREVEMMVDELKVRVDQQGIRFEDYLRVTEKTEASLRDDYREAAEHRVKVLLVLGAIAEKEAISVPDTDVEAEIAHLRAEGAASASVTAYLDTDRGRSYIRSQLRRSALVESLVDGYVRDHPEYANVQHQHRQAHDHREPASADPIEEVIHEESGEDEAELELAAIEAAAAEGAAS